MRDQQYRLASFALDTLQLHVHLFARHGVERAKRLVHQHDLGIMHQRAADRSALLHATGQLPRQLVFEPFEADRLQKFASTRQVLVARQALHVDRKHDVAEHSTPRQQHRTLKDDADVSMRLRHGHTFNLDFAGRGRQQAGDHLQERGFATAGRADHDKKLPFVDMEVQRPQRGHIALARPIGLGDAGKLDARCAAMRGLLRCETKVTARADGR